MPERGRKQSGKKKRWSPPGWLIAPQHPLAFTTFFGVFIMGQLVLLLAHLPGGLGVFDAVTIWGLEPWVGAPTTLAALFAYRILYYLLPLILAVALFMIHEGHHLVRRRPAARMRR